MSEQVIRVGDRVVYTRAHEHPNGDRRSFLVEEVLRPLETMPPQHNARIVPVEGDKTDWSIRPLNILKHDNATGDAIEVFVAPGFLGNPDQWCWWESEYPEEGAIGGYPSKELALDDISRNEYGGTHFHVSVITTPLIGGAFVSDVRRRGRGAWAPRATSTPSRHLTFVAADLESIRRGGSCRTAACLCGWMGPQRATLELAANDALLHERSDHTVTKKDQ